ASLPEFSGGSSQFRVAFCMARTLSICSFVFLQAVLAMAAPITLPLPLYFENFNTAPEGGLPPAWSRTNYSTLPEANFDLVDFDSASYAGWLVLDRNRFTSNFLSYTSHTP